MNRLEGDTYVDGTLQAKTFVPSAACVRDAHLAADAELSASKMQHRHNKVLTQTGTAATETKPIHVVLGATATIKSIKAGSIAACSGAATITIDLKKNGSSILTGVITLDNANTARVMEAGTLSSSSLVVGDFLELVITATAGGGTLGTGLIVQLELDEASV